MVEGCGEWAKRDVGGGGLKELAMQEASIVGIYLE